MRSEGQGMAYFLDGSGSSNVSVCLCILLKYIKRNRKVDSDDSRVMASGQSLQTPFH